jgi:hypothetical protein
MCQSRNNLETPIKKGKHNMPNQLKPGTRRLSYVETRQAAKALDILAAAKSTNVSALIREATEDYLKKVDKDNSVRKLALQIVTELPDDAEERAEADLDPKTMEQLTAVMKKIRR